MRLKCRTEKGMTMIKIEVKEGKLPFVIGIGTVLAGILYAAVAAAHPESLTMAAVFSGGIIFLVICSGIWLCLNAHNRKLVVEDAELCYTNWYGKKKKFTLEEIGECKTAFENSGKKDYIKLYDLQGNKLCKLEYNMCDALLFLQYLLDNQVKVECPEKTDWYLQSIINAEALAIEEIPAQVNAICEKADILVKEWVEKHRQFQADWRMGIVVYLEKEWERDKQIWEQTGYTGTDFPEGCTVVIEGHLQKNGQLVMDKKGHTVVFYVPIVSVSKSWKVGEAIKVRLWGKDALADLKEQLAMLTDMLPKRRYHTEDIVLCHELKERL